MRTNDMEWVELQIKPLRERLSTAETALNQSTRRLKTILARLKDMKRDHKSNVLAVDQACNAARSLLQQANRKARDVGIILEDELPLDDTPADSNPQVSPAVHRTTTGRGVI